MELKEYVKKDPLTSKFVFGRFVKNYRSENDITIRDFADELEISPSYLCEIEKGRKRVPVKLVPILKQKFGIKDDEKQIFDDMVSLSRGYGFADINKYLFSHPLAVEAVRAAQEKNISGDEFLALVNQVYEEREERVSKTQERSLDK